VKLSYADNCCILQNTMTTGSWLLFLMVWQIAFAGKVPKIGQGYPEPGVILAPAFCRVSVLIKRVRIA